MKKLIFIILLLPLFVNSQTLIPDTIYFGTVGNYTRVTFYRNAATTTIAPITAIPNMSNYVTTASMPNMANYSLTSHNHNGLYQPIGTYLTSASLIPYSTTLQANTLYSTIAHNHSGVYQPAGSYLVASDVTGKANLTGALFTGAIGYTTGAGGTVVQATSKTTAVTLNKISGQITMNGAALAAAAEVAFTLTNSTIAATDVVIVNIQSAGTAGAYFVTVGAVAAGSCSITVGNTSTGSLSQAIVLNFTVIKSVAN